jgi:hypothetical protein
MAGRNVRRVRVHGGTQYTVRVYDHEVLLCDNFAPRRGAVVADILFETPRDTIERAAAVRALAGLAGDLLIEERRGQNKFAEMQHIKDVMVSGFTEVTKLQGEAGKRNARDQAAEWAKAAKKAALMPFYEGTPAVPRVGRQKRK